MKKIIALLVLLTLSACSDLDSYELNRLTEGCKQGDGVHHIYIDLIDYHAICNDGSFVE